MSKYPPVFRLYIPDYYPMANYKECKMPKFRSSAHCLRPGLALEIVKLITDHLGIILQPIVPENLTFSYNYLLIYDDLMTDKYDSYALLFQRTTLRSENLSFSNELYTIIRLLADHLNLTIQTRVLSRDYNPSRSYNAMFYDLDNNNTELYAGFFPSTKIKEEKYDFTASLYKSQTKIAVRRTDHSLKSIFDFFTVYNYESWLLLALVFVTFTGFGVFVCYVEWRLGLRETWSPAKLMFKMVRLQLIQPDSIDYRFLSGSASMITFTLFQIGVIVGIYQSWVLSSVIKPKDPFPFRPDELYSVLKSKKYSIVTASKHEWVFNEIQTSIESPFYELRDALKENPIIQKSNAEEALKMANEGKAIIIMPDDQLITFTAEKYCDLVYMAIWSSQMNVANRLKCLAGIATRYQFAACAQRRYVSGITQASGDLEVKDTTYQKQIADLEAKNAELKERIEKLNSRNDSLDGENYDELDVKSKNRIVFDLQLRADAKIKSHKRREAVTILHKAIEVEKSGRNQPGVLCDLWSAIAWTNYRLERYEEALEAARNGHECDPGNAAVLSVLGQSQVALGNNADAIESFKKQLELDPKRTFAKEMLSKLQS